VPGSGELVDVAEYPMEALRLLTERRAALRELGWPSADTPPYPELTAVREGRFDGALWVGPMDEAIGVVGWTPLGRGGRSAELFLTKEYRNPTAFQQLLRRVERSGGPPILKLELPALGWEPTVVAPSLEPTGFRHFVRHEMRYPGERSAPPATPPFDGMRTLRAEDAPATSALLERAYADFPLDPAYFGLGQGTTGEFDREVQEILDGTIGRWRPEASFGVERDGRLVGVTMMNDLHGSLISEVAVDPAHRGRGLARSLIGATIRAIRAQGAPDPRLVVTAVNARARALYLSLGFEPVPFPEENIWVNFRRDGRPELETLLPTLSEGRVDATSVSDPSRGL